MLPRRSQRSRPPLRIAGAGVTLLAAWLSLAGACLGPMLVSDAQEREIGEAIVTELEASEDFHLVHDPEIQSYIDDLAQRVVEASPLQRSFDFVFKVVENEQVNAFALPGGFCYVQTGLIAEASNESELVGVIAHEVSHVTCGHHRNQLANEFLIQTAEGVVFNEESPMVAVAAARIAAGLGMRRYSRGQESEADRAGAEAMWRAGWDPRGLRDFFQRLREIEGNDPGRLALMLSTHPATASRIAELDAQITAYPARNDLVSDTPQFHFVQERVAELVGE